MPKQSTTIRSYHVGRPVDFRSTRPDEQPINGRIERVKNRVATVRFWVVRDTEGVQRAFEPEGFTTYLPVNDSRIIAIY